MSPAAYIDARVPDLLALLQKLVRIETVNAALNRIGARISTLWLMSLPLI